MTKEKDKVMIFHHAPKFISFFRQMYRKLLLICMIIQSIVADHHDRTNQLPDRSAIVHLFEWKWLDIADECERFLAPKGFGGVQVKINIASVLF